MADDSKEPKLEFDKEGIRQFIEEEIKPFLREVDKMTRSDSFAPSLAQIIGKDNPDNPDWFGLRTPLAIGFMATGEGPFKTGLPEEVNKSAQSVVTVLETQYELFDEIIKCAEEMVDKYLKAEGDTLVKIDGEDIIEEFWGVDQLLSQGGTGNKGD
jgi:hypothetical protein